MNKHTIIGFALILCILPFSIAEEVTVETDVKVRLDREKVLDQIEERRALARERLDAVKDNVEERKEGRMENREERQDQRMEQREERKEGREEMREERKEARKMLLDDKLFKKELKFKARMIKEEKREERVAAFKEAKEEFVKEHKAAKEARKSLDEKKKAFKECTSDCDSLEAEVKAEAKVYLGNSADAVIAVLNKFKAKIEASDEISAEEEASLVAKIDAKLKEIEAAKLVLAKSDVTKEEIRAAAKTINASWKGAKEHLTKAKESLEKGRVNALLVQSAHMEVRLENLLSRLERKNQTSVTLEADVEAFSAAVAKAQVDAKLGTADSLESAKKSIKEARTLLQNIMKSVKEEKVDAEFEASAEVEA